MDNDNTKMKGADDARRVMNLREEFYRQARQGAAGLSDKECREVVVSMVSRLMLHNVSLRKAIDCGEWEDAKQEKANADLLRDVMQEGLERPFSVEVDLEAMRDVVRGAESADGEEGVSHE